MAFLVLALFATALIPMDEAKHYVLYKKGRTWGQAQDICEERWTNDAWQLATWNNDAEWNRIVALHKESGSHLGTWVGLSDGPGFWWWEGDWKFIDWDTSYCGGNCKNLPQWAPGEPNDHGNGEDCAEISTGMGNKLNDVDCGRQYWFVCEYPGGSENDDRVSDTIPFVPELPHSDGPVNHVPGTQFVFDFASGQQGVVIVALAASTVIWMAIAAYYCCQFRRQRGKESYSKVVQFSEDERLNAL